MWSFLSCILLNLRSCMRPCPNFPKPLKVEGSQSAQSQKQEPGITKVKENLHSSHKESLLWNVLWMVWQFYFPSYSLIRMTNETMKEQELRMQSHFLVMTFFFFFSFLRRKVLRQGFLEAKRNRKVKREIQVGQSTAFQVSYLYGSLKGHLFQVPSNLNFFLYKFDQVIVQHVLEHFHWHVVFHLIKHVLLSLDAIAKNFL